MMMMICIQQEAQLPQRNSTSDVYKRQTVGQAAASEAETRRYPKRNVARKNYHDSSDEETDPTNFCFCEYYATFVTELYSSCS